MSLLPYAVAVLQLGACLVYAWHNEWRLAVIWLGVAASNFALAGLK